MNIITETHRHLFELIKQIMMPIQLIDRTYIESLFDDMATEWDCVILDRLVYSLAESSDYPIIPCDSTAAARNGVEKARQILGYKHIAYETDEDGDSFGVFELDDVLYRVRWSETSYGGLSLWNAWNSIEVVKPVAITTVQYRSVE